MIGLFSWLLAPGSCIDMFFSLTRTPLATSFVEAGVEMGYDNRDGNGEFQSGFMIPQGTIRRGSR